MLTNLFAPDGPWPDIWAPIGSQTWSNLNSIVILDHTDVIPMVLIGLNIYHVMFLPFSHRNLLRAAAAHTFSTSQLPKAVRTCGAFSILTSTCASRHSDVHISTSKSAPNMVCPVRFDCQICFAPHRRALFHLSSPQMPLHLQL